MAALSVFRFALSEKSKIIAAAAIIVIITSISFSTSINNGFLNYDDLEYVVNNHIIRGLSGEGIAGIFGSFHQENYHPLALLSYALEYRFFGLNPRVYHTTNLLLHLLNCLLAFWFFLLLTKNLSISFLVALFFGAHPTHIESVAWISERRDVLYSFFFLGAMIFYLYHCRRGIKRNFYDLSILFFLLSVLSKAMAVSLPFVLMLLDYFQGRQQRFIDSLKEKMPFLLIAAFFGVVTLWARISGGDIKQGSFLIFPQYVFIVSYVILLYVVKIIFPIGLAWYNPAPGYFFKIHGADMLFRLSVLIAALVFFVSALTRRYTRKIIFGGLFFLIMIFPALLALAYSNRGSFIAYRYVYLPSLGIIYLVAELVYWLIKKKFKGAKIFRPALIGLVLVGAVAMTVLTHQGCRVWKDGVTWWSYALRYYPYSAIAYANRGEAYSLQGKNTQAIADYQRALEINPGCARAYYNLGNTYAQLGKNDTAISAYQKAIACSSNDAAASDAYNNLAAVYSSVGDNSKAVENYKKALRICPYDSRYYYNLGVAYANMGANKEAVSAYLKAIILSPNYASAHYNLAVAYYYQKEYRLALTHSQKAASLGCAANPDFRALLIKQSGK